MNDLSPLPRSGLAFLAGIFMMIACGHASGAQTAHRPIEAPDLRVGDKWVYHGVDGYRQKIAWDETHEITAIGPEGITVAVTTNGSTPNVARTEVWVAPGVVRSGAIYESETDRFDPPLIRYQYPLKRGETWSQRVRDLNKPSGPYGPISFKATVRGYERVTTRAGTFDAIKIRYVMQLDDETISSFPTHCDYIVWYARSVGAAVREQRRSYSMLKGRAPGRVPGQNAIYELTSFTRGP
jgi:hypothetical protein